MRTLRLLAVTVALAGLLPMAAGQVGIVNPNESTPTSLYFHLLDAQNDIPINTQIPNDAYAASARVGLATNSLCFEELAGLPPPANQPLADKEYHTLFGYSSPSYVEYAYLENGKPRLHPERGLSFDVELDQGYPAVLHWFLETHTGVQAQGGVGGQDPNNAPIVIPNVVVRGTMRDGDAISVGDAAYREGNIIMQGESEPAVLAGGTGQTTGATHTTVDGKNVYEFEIPLEIQSPVIPRATGFNFQVEVFIENEYCSDEGDYIMPNLVNVHTSPDHRPYLDLAIMNPIRIEYLHPQFVGEDMVIHSSLNSPWGNYDVDEMSVYNQEDPTGIVIQILDSAGNPAAPSLAEAAFVQRFHEHDHHQEAVDATYIWPYKADGAPNGLYTVTMEVWNDQRTAMASGVATFELGRGIVNACGDTAIGQDGISSNDDCFVDEQADGKTQSQGSPGIGPIALLGVLAAALLVLRRRAA
jgi:hypothetical protein